MKKVSILLCIVLVLSLFGSLVASCGEPEPETAPAPAPAPAPEPEPAPAPAPEPVVLKMASAATANYIDGEQAFADDFNATCGPDYTIEYYPAEQMIGFMEMLDAVRTGATEIGVVTPNFYSFDEPKLGATEIPFLLNNLDAHRYAVPKLMPLYAGILENQFNQKLLCLHNYTGMALIGTKPVKTMDDWDGLLTQAISPVIASTIDALGGAPVTGVMYTESYSMLEKGTVEAVITAPAAMRVFALTDVADYMTAVYLTPAVHGFSINLNVWNKLPKDIQDTLLEKAQKHSDIIDEWLVDEWVKDHEAIAAAGVEIYYLPQAEVDKWKAACQSVIDDLLVQYGDFGAQIMAIADEANAKYPNE
jgi:TRAP-type C4-dicarboxylate transport system substrate-binding protein